MFFNGVIEVVIPFFFFYFVLAGNWRAKVMSLAVYSSFKVAKKDGNGSRVCIFCVELLSLISY